MNRLELIYKHLNIPTHYASIEWDDTTLVAVKKNMYLEKFKNPPKRGLVGVTGTAAPIVNSLYSLGKKLLGIDFTTRSSTAFESHTNPSCDVVVIYSIGDEVSVNHNITGQVLRGIISAYQSKNTLVVLESRLTKSEMRTRYDVDIVNHVNLKLKPEDTWL